MSPGMDNASFSHPSMVLSPKSGKLVDITRIVLVSVCFFGLSGLPVLEEFGADSKILN